MNVISSHQKKVSQSFFATLLWHVTIWCFAHRVAFETACLFGSYLWLTRGLSSSRDPKTARLGQWARVPQSWGPNRDPSHKKKKKDWKINGQNSDILTQKLNFWDKSQFWIQKSKTFTHLTRDGCFMDHNWIKSAQLIAKTAYLLQEAKPKLSVLRKIYPFQTSPIQMCRFPSSEWNTLVATDIRSISIDCVGSNEHFNTIFPYFDNTEGWIWPHRKKPMSFSSVGICSGLKGISAPTFWLLHWFKKSWSESRSSLSIDTAHIDLQQSSI